MNYLLDTNICIAVLNNRPIGVQAHLQKIVGQGHSTSVSAITAFELWYGAYKSQLVERNTERLAIFFSPIELVPFDGEDALVAGRLRAQLERDGMPIGPFDLLIAAHAVRHDLVLVTNNFREFKRIPDLHTEDWISDAAS